MTGQINNARLYSLHHRAMNTMKNEILESSILLSHENPKGITKELNKFSWLENLTNKEQLGLR